MNEYTWNNGSTSRGITVTLAGTQGADGKSRVLFYLGSFDNRNGKTPTLEGDSVEGHLTDERCDYYIDRNGNAWMRTGVEDKDGVGVPGNANGNAGNANWKASEKVGFLQANAITADMINAGSITAESAIVSKLFSEEITANNLKVSNANISEKLTADKIDVTNLSVNTLNTKPDNNQDKIVISDNYIYCLDGDSKRNLKISSDNINMNCLDALFTPISEDNSNTYSNVPSWTSRGTGAYGGVNYINTKSVTSGQGTLSVSDDATIDDINANGKCSSIGYLFANTNISITLKVALCLLDSYWGNETTTYKPVSGIYWNIIKGNAPGWGLTQTGGVSNNTNTGGYLLVYKLNNENGIYEPYKQYSLSGTWKTTGDVSIGGMTINNSGNYKVKEVENINIDSDGMYGIEVVFEPYSITYEKTSATSVAPSDMYINARFTINTDLPNQYTEIGKNGLISFNEDNAIALDSNGVIMKSKNCENGTYNFYGLKVNKSGIYIGNNNTDWKKLNLDKMIELGIIEDTTTTE